MLEEAVILLTPLSLLRDAIIADLKACGRKMEAATLYAQIPAVEFDKATEQVTAVVDPCDEGGVVGDVRLAEVGRHSFPINLLR